MKNKVTTILKCLLWCVFVLLFPISSGAISIIWGLNSTQTLFLQGLFMMLALVPALLLIAFGKWSWKKIGISQFNPKLCKKALFFAPIAIIFVPVAIKGFEIKSTEYLFGCLFLYLFVGITEEVYFRGVIPNCLKTQFSSQGVVLLSAFIFAIGHSATAFAGINLLSVVLTVANAFIFGLLAIKVTMISSNILPAIVMHFCFNFETKIIVLTGSDLLIAQVARGLLMLVMVAWLSFVLHKNKNLLLETK